MGCVALVNDAIVARVTALKGLRAHRDCCVVEAERHRGAQNVVRRSAERYRAAIPS